MRRWRVVGERERETVHCVVSDTCQSPIAYSCYGLIKTVVCELILCWHESSVLNRMVYLTANL